MAARTPVLRDRLAHKDTWDKPSDAICNEEGHHAVCYRADPLVDAKETQV